MKDELKGNEERLHFIQRKMCLWNSGGIRSENEEHAKYFPWLCWKMKRYEKNCLTSSGVAN